MDTRKINRRNLFSWGTLALMIVLLCVLAVLQYQWIGQISEAAQQRLQENLRNGLDDLSREFDATLSTGVAALVPTASEVTSLGRESAYASRYNSWKASGGNSRIFATIALAWNEGERSRLCKLGPDAGAFVPAEWPPAWRSIQDWVESRAPFAEGNARPRPRPPVALNVIDVPRFGPVGADLEQDWLLLELDPSATAASMLPGLLSKHLGPGYGSEYRVQVTARADPSQVIYRSDPAVASMYEPDASVNLFDARVPGRGEGGDSGKNGKRPKDKEGRRGRLGPPPLRDKGPGPPDRARGRGGDGPGGPDDRGPGRWLLSVKMRSGSLDSFVAQARRRNLAVSGGVLALLLTTVLVLVRFTRQSQRLADMQMDFVAGVSHELRTPLTVIRTAAYNLRGKLSGSPRQVEQYGALIQQESEKLTALIEQVMEFSRTSSGQVLRERQPVPVEQLIEESLESSRSTLEQAACRVEKDVAQGLPPIMGDAVALRQAVQNLINNALKYGGSTYQGTWIGIRARGLATPEGASIEIRVSDHGTGIPLDEQRHIFDPFFRGRKAVEDQVHGTGLGLSLVKRIVEAHGGTVGVESQPGTGTTIVVTIPAGRPGDTAANIPGDRG